MLTLSTIILTHNEETNIKACIRSCLFSDEIIIVDDYSSDKTIDLAKSVSSKVKVIKHSLNDNWAAQRNFAMKQSQCDYILFIDADERISPDLQKDIVDILQNCHSDSCFQIKRITSLEAGEPRHGIFRPDYVTRLMPRSSGMFERSVHEVFISSKKNKKLRGHLIHHTYHDWDAYWRKFNQYTKLSAETYAKKRKKVNFIRDIVARPIWAFIKVYILNLGFLDGKLGWIFSINHMAYTLAKYSRLWSMQKFNNKI